jgi:hypothetical protein
MKYYIKVCVFTVYTWNSEEAASVLQLHKLEIRKIYYLIIMETCDLVTYTRLYNCFLWISNPYVDENLMDNYCNILHNIKNFPICIFSESGNI